MHPAKDWYKNTREYLQEKYGPDWVLVTRLIAATSPRKQLRPNLNLAHRIYESYKAGREYSRVGMLPIHIKNVDRVLAGEPLSGPKVSAFADAILGDERAVVIDVWICRYFKHGKKPTPRQRERLEQQIIHNASRRGLAPAEYQAIIWTISRKKGIAGKSYKRKYSLQEAL